MKNGWKRIGIIASILWILAAGLYTLNAAEERDTKARVRATLSCEESMWAGAHITQAECDKFLTEGFKTQLEAEWLEAAIVAFVPVPFAWGFVYLILFLVRWVHRGFATGIS